MAAPSSVRGLAITALVLLLSASTRASALAPRQNNHTASTPPASDGSGSGDGSDENLRPWVTVNAQGVAATVTPTVQDGKYTSTFAGNAKTPTANPDGSGAFLVCNEQTGSGGKDQPICAPANGAQVIVGQRYFGRFFFSFFFSILYLEYCRPANQFFVSSFSNLGRECPAR